MKLLIADTERLVLRWLEIADAAFILRLVNDPSWLQYIGDKGVHTIEDAEAYIRSGPREMYQRLGFGLNLVQLKEPNQPIGICGILKRDTLEHPDLGFALLPEYWGQGYAFEAAQAVMEHGHRELNLSTLSAITSTDNAASVRLLRKLGFHFERLAALGKSDEAVKLFRIELQPAD